MVATIIIVCTTCVYRTVMGGSGCARPGIKRDLQPIPYTHTDQSIDFKRLAEGSIYRDITVLMWSLPFLDKLMPCSYRPIGSDPVVYIVRGAVCGLLGPRDCGFIQVLEGFFVLPTHFS